MNLDKVRAFALGMRHSAELILSLAYLLFSGILLGVVVGLMLPIVKYGLKLLLFMIA